MRFFTLKFTLWAVADERSERTTILHFFSVMEAILRGKCFHVSYFLYMEFFFAVWQGVNSVQHIHYELQILRELLQLRNSVRKKFILNKICSSLLVFLITCVNHISCKRDRLSVTIKVGRQVITAVASLISLPQKIPLLMLLASGIGVSFAYND